MTSFHLATRAPRAPVDPRPLAIALARARELARVRAHLVAVERALRAAPPGLCAARAARRRAVLAHLRRYIAAGRFPANRVSAEPVPVFVDPHGARCAVASLLEATGQHALVARVARAANLARVHALASDAALARWLDHHGLTVDEAARIQPAYGSALASHWQPTVSVVSSAQGGGSTATGGQFALATGFRVGARRSTEHQSTSGSMSYSSVALLAEYNRSWVIGAGNDVQLGLLVQWEPAQSHRDVQWYLQAGPLLALDEDRTPGNGLGGQLGAGLSFRTRSYPLLIELVGQALAQSGGASVRGGVQFGVVF